jgi:GTPase involved in cell partitioning and DNA repair
MSDDQQAPVDPATPEAGGGQAGGAVEEQPSADEQMKARYREALAHKHGSSGAHRTVHGDKGEEAHSQSAGPSQKMFRRKAGG